MLKVESYRQDERLKIQLEGVLDISTKHIFEDYPLNTDNLSLVIIDFSKLEFIDSTGIGIIMDIIFLAQEKGFSIEFEQVDEQIHDVFEMVGLYQILASTQGGIVS